MRKYIYIINIYKNTCVCDFISRHVISWRVMSCDVSCHVSWRSWRSIPVIMGCKGISGIRSIQAPWVTERVALSLLTSVTSGPPTSDKRRLCKRSTAMAHLKTSKWELCGDDGAIDHSAAGVLYFRFCSSQMSRKQIRSRNHKCRMAFSQ